MAQRNALDSWKSRTKCLKEHTKWLKNYYCYNHPFETTTPLLHALSFENDLTTPLSSLLRDPPRALPEPHLCNDKATPVITTVITLWLSYTCPVDKLKNEPHKRQRTINSGIRQQRNDTGWKRKTYGDYAESEQTYETAGKAQKRLKTKKQNRISCSPRWWCDVGVKECLASVIMLTDSVRASAVSDEQE